MYPLRFHLLYSPPHSWRIRLFINSVIVTESTDSTTEFTFHNVSINSKELDEKDKIFIKFTFHNVSINS